MSRCQGLNPGAPVSITETHCGKASLCTGDAAGLPVLCKTIWAREGWHLLPLQQPLSDHKGVAKASRDTNLPLLYPRLLSMLPLASHSHKKTHMALAALLLPRLLTLSPEVAPTHKNNEHPPISALLSEMWEVGKASQDL